MIRQADAVKPARGARLLAARERAGLEQQKVAAALEVTRGTLRRWERGHWLSAGALAQLAVLYGVTEEVLQGPPGEPGVSAASSRGPSPEPPQWARQAWARLYAELVERGVSESDCAFLRRFVLSRELFARSLPDADVRLDVEAGVLAVRAWVDARYPTAP
jgi:transcriptional regulator with XRE-family HTH domain